MKEVQVVHAQDLKRSISELERVDAEKGMVHCFWSLARHNICIQNKMAPTLAKAGHRFLAFSYFSVYFFATFGFQSLIAIHLSS